MTLGRSLAVIVVCAVTLAVFGLFLAAPFLLVQVASTEGAWATMAMIALTVPWWPGIVSMLVVSLKYMEARQIARSSLILKRL